MAVTLRTGKVYLAKNIKMDREYKSVLGISESDMITLITNSNNLVYSSTNCSFIRDEREILLNCSYGLALQSNYIAFQNPDYSGKWFFGFVDKVTYVSNGVTKITYTTDLFTTWWSYWSSKACFVVREHVTDDTPGLHTIPEDLDTGDYIVDFEKTNLFLTPYKFILATTVDYSIDSQTGVVTIQGDNGGGIYGGIKTAYRYYYFASNQANSKLSDVLKAYAQAGKIDAIGSIFVAPTFLINRTYPTVEDDGDITEDYNPVNLYWNDSQPWDLTRPFTLDSYTPVNNKLLCYPYCYLMMSNNSGGNAIYNYEYFETSPSSNYAIDFLIRGVLTPSMSGLIAPINYKGLSVNYSESLQLPKYPICGWQSDLYTNWLTQQGINNTVNILKNTLTASTGGGALLGPVGNLLGGLGGLAISTANIALEMKQHEFIPPQANGNTNTGDVTTAMNRNTFTAYGMCIRREYASIIDKVFTRTGYKVSTIKIPNLSHRQNYNYVEIGKSETLCYSNNYNNIMVPAKDLESINNMFRNGITIWNNHTNLGDYSVSNAITN